MNQKNLIACFLLLPWLPDARIASKLQRVSSNITRLIETKLPDMNSRYLWHFTGAKTPVVFGRFGLSNVRCINSLHVSMFPNFLGPPHKFVQLHESLLRGIKTCPPPSDMVVESEPNNMDKMLGKGPSKYVSLRFKPNLSCYLSSNSGSVFIALDIYEGRNQDLREIKYLRQIGEMVVDNLDDLGFQYNWSTIGVVKKEGEKLPQFRYHMTVLLGEVYMFEKRLSHQEYIKLRELLRSVNVADYIGDINLDVNKLGLLDINGRSYTIPLAEGW